MLYLGFDNALQYTYVIHHPDMAYSLPETADSLHGSKEPHVCTGMVLSSTGLHLPDSKKLHHSLSADEYQVLETVVGATGGRIAG
ncbi:hypothetical protein ACFX1S_003604 [Malus domestica]